MPATGPDGLCWVHTKENADARRRGQSRGGRGRAGRELADLKRRILETVDGVLAGTLDRGRAAVGIQGLNALRAALELERRVKETEELESRLIELEDAQSMNGRGRQGLSGAPWD
ncbi:MAG: hypothetical protein M3N45_11620 [Actinomycetota bacterium]|nr:hypothetical protein [Actinomycetota bacterium]